MQILVTGYRGFIGSHLCELLKEEFIGLDLKDGWDIRHCQLPPFVTHVFHFAAKRSVPGGEAEPESFISHNCWGTTRLIRQYPKARIINISSSAASEAKSVYGATKQFAESIGNQHKNCLNVRLYNVFGERQTLESGAVVPHFINAMLNGTAPLMYGHGKPTRDFTYVKDVCLELMRLMFETADTGLAHVGYSDSITVQELLDMIYPNCPETQSVPLRDFEIMNNKAPYSLKRLMYGRIEGLYRTTEWWRQQHALSIPS